MNFVDDKYISLISSKLQKFAKKKSGLYNFRCPYCGDSQKYKNKARGYLYAVKNDYNFKCHNCGVTRTFTNFLKDQDVLIHDQYVMERYKNGLTGKRSNTPEPKFNFEKPVFSEKKKIFDLPKISELNKEHPARIYLEQNRQLPLPILEDLYYCQKFKEWTNVQKYTFEKIEKDEPRIIIPLRYNGNIVGYQGRSLLSTSKIKYITIMLEDESPKIYGMDKINKGETIYVTEGPFDSTFVPNSIALCGADGDLSKWGIDDPVWVYDNEPRNAQIISRYASAIARGERIVIWPTSIKEKDINDMVLSGLNVMDVLKSNIYKGLEAKLKLQTWKRV